MLLLNPPIITVINAFPVPIVLRQVSPWRSCVQLVNAFLIGLFGADYLAAGALSTSIYTAFLIIGIGILNTVCDAVIVFINFLISSLAI